MKNPKKFLGKRVLIPPLDLDFLLYAEEKDAKQLDIFMNFMMSLWKMEGKNEVKVHEQNNN